MATPLSETTEERQYTTLLSHHENNSRQGAEIQRKTERETPERLTDRSRGTWKRQKLEENKIFRVNWTQYQGRTKDMLTGKPQPYYHIKTEPEWADRGTAQEGAARTDAAGRGNGAGLTFWVITEQ